MQSVIRFIITLLFIGLIVIGVVFFSIVAVVPKDKLTKIKNKDFSSTETTGKKSLLDISLFAPIRALIDEVSKGGSSTGNIPTPINTSGPINTYPADLPQPQASRPLLTTELPTGVEKIAVSEAGFKPNIFKVKEGEQVVLVIENKGKKTHSFAFKDQLFAPVNVSVAPGESRGIQFYALRKGEFVFRCDLPGHEDAGEVGTMVVE